MADITQPFLGTIVGFSAHQHHYWMIRVDIMPNDPIGMPGRIFTLWDRDNPISLFMDMRVWCAPGPGPLLAPRNYVVILGIVDEPSPP